MWMYHSHVDEAADPNAGLMGAIIITPQANANQDATPKDVSRCVRQSTGSSLQSMTLGSEWQSKRETFKSVVTIASMQLTHCIGIG
jgi:hypothetical protein